MPEFAQWAWTVGPFLWGRSSVPCLEDFHTKALRICPGLFLASVQVAFGAGHGFVAEDQLDSVGVNAAFCQRRTAAMLQAVNVTHGVGDRRLAPSYSRQGRQLAGVSNSRLTCLWPSDPPFLLTKTKSDGSLLRRRSFSHARRAVISQSAGRPRCLTIGCTVFRLLLSRWMVISWLFQFKSASRSLAISWFRRPWVKATTSSA